MSLDKALKNLKYDVRFLEYNLNNGQLTKDELKAHLSTVQDVAANSEPLRLEDERPGDSH
jgi:hypothetical protein